MNQYLATFSVSSATAGIAECSCFSLVRHVCCLLCVWRCHAQRQICRQEKGQIFLQDYLCLRLLSPSPTTCQDWFFVFSRRPGPSELFLLCFIRGAV